MEQSQYRTIAVIPARGGSKRLPRKSILGFNGKPMIAHTIDAAKNSMCFDQIIVSSDSLEVLKIARKYGATPLKRSSKLSDDKTTTATVLIDVLNQQEAEGMAWDILVCLYATAPLRHFGDIREVTQMIKPGVCDYAMAVCEANRPIHQAMLSEDGVLKPAWPELVNKNSQFAPKYLFGNGSTYAVSVPAFRVSQTLYGPGLQGYEMPPERSVDIDTEADLRLATYYSNLHSQ